MSIDVSDVSETVTDSLRKASSSVEVKFIFALEDNISFENISKYTGLTIDEINNL